MLSVRMLLLVLAFLCEFLAAIGAPTARINLVALGLALWMLTLLL
jgi:hypothetical protein